MDELIAKIYYNRIKTGQMTIEQIPSLKIAVIVERMLMND